MQIHPIDINIRKFWKVYPLRISGQSTCRDCNEGTVLVQSKSGGFITRNCPNCNNPETLPNRVFENLDLWIACPSCKHRMEATMLHKNYGYVCYQCDIGIPLHELLPMWEDL